MQLTGLSHLLQNLENHGNVTEVCHISRSNRKMTPKRHGILCYVHLHIAQTCNSVDCLNREFSACTACTVLYDFCGRYFFVRKTWSAYWPFSRTSVPRG